MTPAVRSPRRLLAVLLLLLCLVGSSPAGAFAATPRTTLEDVEAELMCSTCKVPLNQSEAPQADQERQTIERLVAQGKTKDQIIDEMVQIYTESVLINPPDKGVRTLRWLLPVIVGLLSVSALAVLIRRWRRRAAEAAETTSPGGDGDRPRGPDDDPADRGDAPRAPADGPGRPASGDERPADDAADELSDADRRRLDSDLARYE